MNPEVTAFFHAASSTYSYVVAEPGGLHCAIVDPVLDFDPKTGRTATDSVDQIVSFIEDRGLKVDWILETHAHADHLSAAPHVKAQLGGKIAIGRHITEVQQIFKKLFNAGSEFAVDGSQFDHLFDDDESFAIGELAGQVIHTPGHTPACVTYLIGDAAFVGDTLFMPDVGTARTDFPGGDADILYRSVQAIFSLPPETRLFMCHDYPPEGRDHDCQTTVADEREGNIHVKDAIAKDDFIAMRKAKDKASDAPVLLLPSIQVNMRAGGMPPAEDNGVSYLKIPLNQV